MSFSSGGNVTNCLKFSSVDISNMLESCVMSVTSRAANMALLARRSISSSARNSFLRSRISFRLPTSIWLTV